MSSNKMYASPTFNVLRDSYDNSAADNFRSVGATPVPPSANGSSGFKEMLSAASTSPVQEDDSKIVNGSISSRFFGNLVGGAAN